MTNNHTKELNRAMGVSGFGVLGRMSSAEEYIKHASDCLALAQQVQDSAVKIRLLEMAQAWRELAQKSEGEDDKNDTPVG
jgi:hypothetical protein